MEKDRAAEALSLHRSKRHFLFPAAAAVPEAAEREERQGKGLSKKALSHDCAPCSVRSASLESRVTLPTRSRCHRFDKTCGPHGAVDHSARSIPLKCLIATSEKTHVI
ncbi:hypothetical protein EYF80_040081 [Liparis tanakae]|uniref:Uncharacterized protein n=1 Tax=Liparis tanakae TaxID=230148 RepID=A0A4Z2GAV9_9TELE|nr:hypothetical protein EYF80_040081 [Liparis tanakae]